MANYAVSYCPPHCSLTDLGPFIQVDEAKFRRQVVNELAARILGLIQVHFQICQHDGFLTLEVCQGLL